MAEDPIQKLREAVERQRRITAEVKRVAELIRKMEKEQAERERERESGEQ